MISTKSNFTFDKLNTDLEIIEDKNDLIMITGGGFFEQVGYWIGYYIGSSMKNARELGAGESGYYPQGLAL